MNRPCAAAAIDLLTTVTDRNCVSFAENFRSDRFDEPTSIFSLRIFPRVRQRMQNPTCARNRHQNSDSVMSIDYGNCDRSDCWYHGNPDRLNEYSEDDEVELVSNCAYVDMILNTGTDPPFSFTLCRVCWENSDLRPVGNCMRCRRRMIDPGLELRKGEELCVLCKEDFDGIGDDADEFDRDFYGGGDEHDHSHLPGPGIDDDRIVKCARHYDDPVECSSDDEYWGRCPAVDWYRRALVEEEGRIILGRQARRKRKREVTENISKLYGVKDELAGRLEKRLRSGDVAPDDSTDAIMKHILKALD